MGQHFHDVWVIGMPRRNKIPTLQYWLPIKLSGNPQRTTTKLLLTSCRSYHSTRKTHCSKGLGRTDGPGCFLAEDVVHEDAMLHIPQGTLSISRRWFMAAGTAGGCRANNLFDTTTMCSQHMSCEVNRQPWNQHYKKPVFFVIFQKTWKNVQKN